MPRQARDLPPRRHIPQPHRVVERPGSEHRTIRAEGHGIDPAPFGDGGVQFRQVREAEIGQALPFRRQGQEGGGGQGKGGSEDSGEQQEESAKCEIESPGGEG